MNGAFTFRSRELHRDLPWLIGGAVLAAALLLALTARAATPTFSSFDLNDFRITTSPTAPWTINANRTGVTNIFNHLLIAITNSTLNVSNSTNVFNNTTNVIENSLVINTNVLIVNNITTNITENSTLIYTNTSFFITNGPSIITISTNITINGTNVATINPTDGRLPVRGGYNWFYDSPISVVSPSLEDVIFDAALYFHSTDVGLFAGAGSPEGVKAAKVGSLFIRTNGAAGTTLYTKTNGVGDTGWSPFAVGGGGDSIWTNISGVIQPIPDNAYSNVYLSNFVTRGTVSSQSKGVVLSLGTNVIAAGVDSQLILVSPSSDPTQVILSLNGGSQTVQHLRIINYTNGVPDNGAFTLPNGSDIADLPGGKVRLSSDWVATNGFVLDLDFVSPDWIETGRWNINTGGGGNDLWVNSAGVLQPVDLGLQPLVKNGWFTGTNSQTMWGGLLGSDWALVSVADNTKGESFRGISIATGDGDLVNNYSQFTVVTTTNQGTITLQSSDGSNGSVVTIESGQAIGGAGLLDISYGGFTGVHLEPGIANGSTPHVLDTSVAHTAGNLLEVANAGTNKLTVGAFGGTLGVGQNSKDWWGTSFDNGEALISARVTSRGDPNYNALYIATSQEVNGTTAVGRFSAESYTNRIVVASAVVTNGIFWDMTYDINLDGASPWVLRGRAGSSDVIHWEPLIGENDDAVGFLLHTERAFTKPLFAKWDNNGTDLFGLTSDGKLWLPQAHTPASSSETNRIGAITWDANNLYIWTATNVNKKVALTAY